MPDAGLNETTERLRTVADLGEDPLVADLITRYPGADWLVVGPGDDAAVLDLTRFPGRLVVCTDTLVEGQDFRTDWSTGRDVGIKAAAQNFADIAAMGARPHALLISLTTPAGVPAAWARELAEGAAQECTRAGAVVAGGDLSAGSELVVTGTAIGTLSGSRAVLRSGARPGNVVAIAGVSGRSAAGWALLRHGFGARPSEQEPSFDQQSSSASEAPPDHESTLDQESSAQVLAAVAALIGEHRRPRPPYAAGPEAALAGATALIDTSDGLLRDAERIARASRVVLALDRAALRPDADLLIAARLLDEADPAGWVLTGGEDHALLACFPPDVELPPSYRRIGAVRALSEPADEGHLLLDGEPVTGPGGWRHFG